MTENEFFEEELERPLKKRKIDEVDESQGKEASASPFCDATVVSSTTLEDGRPKAKDTVGSEEEVENGSKRRLSCSNDSELAVGESSSVSGGNDRPRASPGAATSGTESRDAVEDLITRHSQQIGVVMPDAASFAKMLKKAVAKRVTSALRQETSSLEKKIVWLENQNRELQWTAKKLSIACRQTKEKKKNAETEDRGTQVSMGMIQSRAAHATSKSTIQGCSDVPNSLSQSQASAQSSQAPLLSHSRSQSQTESQSLQAPVPIQLRLQSHSLSSQAPELTQSRTQPQTSQAPLLTQSRPEPQTQLQSSQVRPQTQLQPQVDSVRDALLAKPNAAVRASEITSHRVDQPVATFQQIRQHQQAQQLHQRKQILLQLQQQQQIHQQQQQQQRYQSLEHQQERQQQRQQLQLQQRQYQQQLQQQQQRHQLPEQQQQQWQQLQLQQQQQWQQRQQQQQLQHDRQAVQQQQHDRQAVQQQMQQQLGQEKQHQYQQRLLQQQQLRLRQEHQQQPRMQSSASMTGVSIARGGTAQQGFPRTVQQPVTQVTQRLGVPHTVQQSVTQVTQQLGVPRTVQQPVTQVTQELGGARSIQQPVMQVTQQLGVPRTVQQPVTQVTQQLGVPHTVKQSVTQLAQQVDVPRTVAQVTQQLGIPRTVQQPVAQLTPQLGVPRTVQQPVTQITQQLGVPRTVQQPVAQLTPQLGVPRTVQQPVAQLTPQLGVPRTVQQPVTQLTPQLGVPRTVQQPVTQLTPQLGVPRTVQQPVTQATQQLGVPRTVQQPVTQLTPQLGVPRTVQQPVTQATQQLGVPRTVQQPVTRPTQLGVSRTLHQPVRQSSRPLASHSRAVQPPSTKSTDRQVVVIPDSPPEQQPQPTSDQEGHDTDGLFQHWKFTSVRSSGQQSNASPPGSATQIQAKTPARENNTTARHFGIQPSLQALTHTVPTTAYYRRGPPAPPQAQSLSEPISSKSHINTTQSTAGLTTRTGAHQQAFVHSQTPPRHREVQPGQSQSRVSQSSGMRMSAQWPTAGQQNSVPGEQHQHAGSSAGPQANVHNANTAHNQTLVPQSSSKASSVSGQSSSLPQNFDPPGNAGAAVKQTLSEQTADQDPEIIITSVVSQKGTEHAQLMPAKPCVSISVTENGIVLSWNMDLEENMADIDNYELFTLQDEFEDLSVSSALPWKRIGQVKAMPLPMACTLTQFLAGNKYHFSVRAVDVHDRAGPFSDACTVILTSS